MLYGLGFCLALQLGINAYQRYTEYRNKKRISDLVDESFKQARIDLLRRLKATKQ